MTYPVVSLFLVIGIASFLMIGIVPSFKPVFESLEVELPGSDRRDHGHRVLHARLLVRVIFGGARRLFFGDGLEDTEQGKRTSGTHIMLRVPVFGPLFKKVALSRFARTFSTLVKSGVPILGAMEIVSETAGQQA